MSIDASGARPILVPKDASDELLLAIARVEASLRVVLAAINEMQREMGIAAPPSSSVPLRPDPSWVGTP